MKAKDDSHPRNLNEKAEWVHKHALQLGFIDSALVSLQGVDPGYSTYLHWIDQGLHTPLDYMAKNRELRKTPQSLEPGLLSAFVFLHPYPRDKPSPMIARYAWGKDYHITMKGKLFELSQNYNNHHEQLTQERICVDTAPILERSIAQRSGLGWIGKNGCMISRKHGSWFLIGIWLTSLAVAVDAPGSPGFHCGTCTKCLDACPTDAFVQPGMLNANLCLSTQTIENRGAFPKDMIGKLEQQAFGCDICQEVCPWNRKHPIPTKENFLPGLNELLNLPEASFRNYFRKTPLERPTWAGLRRNFLILAADKKEVPDETISNHLKDERELIRKTAQQVLNFRQSNQ